MMYNLAYLGRRVTLPFLDLRSNFDLDLSRSNYTWFDAPWRDKHDRVTIVVLSFKTKMLSSKNHFGQIWPFDSWWPVAARGLRSTWGPDCRPEIQLKPNYPAVDSLEKLRVLPHPTALRSDTLTFGCPSLIILFRSSSGLWPKDFLLRSEIISKTRPSDIVGSHTQKLLVPPSPVCSYTPNATGNTVTRPEPNRATRDATMQLNGINIQHTVGWVRLAGRRGAAFKFEPYQRQIVYCARAHFSVASSGGDSARPAD